MALPDSDESAACQTCGPHTSCQSPILSWVSADASVCSNVAW
ncbi:hypothetical protein [Xanthomonas arboricola]|nr:hypothetical protein [Xanthomonas arboricola]